jgi:Fic family protein
MFSVIFLAIPTLTTMLNTQHITITPEVLALITQIDEFKGAWRALGLLAPERLLALRRVATIESVASSTRIEGSKLTNAEVDALLSNIKVKKFTTRDEQEVAGYADVMALLFASWEHIPFNENHIQQLHRELLQYSSKDDHHRGQYKKVSNNVAAFNEKGEQLAVVFETASPFDTPRLMQELVEWVRYARENKTLHPLLIVAVFVVVFLEIHPFEDGNGRLSRILTTLLMLQLGYSYVPYSSLESIIEQNKSGYYIALRQTQGTIRTDHPNWQPWIVFFLSSLASQVKRLGEKVEREKLLTQHLPKLSADLVALARQHGRLTTTQAQEQTGANRATIKTHLAKLVRDGHLIKHGVGRGTWYVAAQ